jgi:hypothetical protein
MGVNVLIAVLAALSRGGCVAPAAPAVVHGDFRLDNLAFDEQLQVRGEGPLLLRPALEFMYRVALPWKGRGGGVGDVEWEGQPVG